ncbi:hypothetical protein [Flavobacterium sp. NKUCC04_CG]|uniref:hypothetical protein n=1 Tax=Flavobacterium sp. NKUCC04_CG TaxID=2842121 RepID=UPI001C5BD114|nr:hypothetical protein [Flavobacterium sp. NKUCC04_CG]MBW3519958.1 hypothetical protein [Flavobacterium sp. NKUCC04_CG]
MIKKIDWVRLGTLVFTLMFIGSAVFFEIFELGTLPTQVFGALLGVVITAIITVLLLQGQTKSEEKREIHLLVFEKKQEVYFDFLNKFNHILQNQEFRIHLDTKKTQEYNDINLQDLLFEFGYLQMHTSAVVFDQILEHMGRLLEANNHLQHNSNGDTAAIKQYYNSLTREYFAIIALLKTELYPEKDKEVDLQKINTILQHSMDKGVANLNKKQSIPT